MLLLEKALKLLAALFSGEPGSGTVLLVKTAHSPDGRNRVCFFHRKEDGIFGFREEVYEDRSIEACWIPMKQGHVEEYKSLDAALAAAKAEVPWLHLVLP